MILKYLFENRKHGAELIENEPDVDCDGIIRKRNLDEYMKHMEKVDTWGGGVELTVFHHIFPHSTIYINETRSTIFESEIQDFTEAQINIIIQKYQLPIIINNEMRVINLLLNDKHYDICANTIDQKNMWMHKNHTHILHAHGDDDKNYSTPPTSPNKLNTSNHTNKNKLKLTPSSPNPSTLIHDLPPSSPSNQY